MWSEPVVAVVNSRSDRARRSRAASKGTAMLASSTTPTSSSPVSTSTSVTTRRTVQLGSQRRTSSKWSGGPRYRTSIGKALLDLQLRGGQHVGDSCAGATVAVDGSRSGSDRGRTARGRLPRSPRGRTAPSTTFSPRSRPSWRLPMFDRRDAEERALADGDAGVADDDARPAKSLRKSSGGMLRKKCICAGSSVSRKMRMPFDVPSEPASTFGQNQSVGTSSRWSACSVSITCVREASYSVVTGCWRTSA